MGNGTGTLSMNLIQNKQSKTCPSQAKFKSYLSKGQTGIQGFFQSCYIHSHKLDLQKNVSCFIIAKLFEKIICVFIHVT